MSEINYSEFKKPPHQMQESHWGESFVFDIETQGIPSRVREYADPYPEFVEPKYGNTKDPVKKQALRAAKYDEWVNGEDEWWKQKDERSALNPLTGRVVAIGYLHPYSSTDGAEEPDQEYPPRWDNITIDGLSSSGNHEVEERAILGRFWCKVIEACASYGHIIGHNIEEFDLPFLIRRSWMLNVPVAPMIRRGRYYHQNVVDTMKVWALTDYKKFVGLNDLAKILGVGKKMEGYDATQFAHDWLVGDKDTAEFYLKTDVNVTHEVYRRLYA